MKPVTIGEIREGMRLLEAHTGVPVRLVRGIFVLPPVKRTLHSRRGDCGVCGLTAALAARKGVEVALGVQKKIDVVPIDLDNPEYAARCNVVVAAELDLDVDYVTGFLLGWDRATRRSCSERCYEGWGDALDITADLEREGIVVGGRP